jgi:hypothetical protein
MHTHTGERRASCLASCSVRGIELLGSTLTQPAVFQKTPQPRHRWWLLYMEGLAKCDNHIPTLALPTVSPPHTFVSRSGTPSAMMATVRMVACLRASSEESNALGGGSKEV